MEVLSNPIVAVVLLGVLVVVHEAGHFIVGRLCGIAVETFSVGFGPRIWHYTKDKTTYCKYYSTRWFRNFTELFHRKKFLRVLTV